MAQDMAFTEDVEGRSQARLLREQFALFFGDGRWDRAVFMMRLGAGKAPVARSLRKPLTDLIES